MAFNPLEEKGIPIDRQPQNWSTLNIQPYNKNEVDPYTRCRVILMNGIEVESAMFLHQFNRHTDDVTLKQKLGAARRAEQQQQKMVNWLVPADESTLEVTIGYEQVAVDLTAYLARTEPNPYVKQALDFALLEDFDHLYRYANLLEMDQGIKAERIVGGLTEITIGRPTIVEHRHPFDEVRRHYDKNTADILTKLHVETITAGEQQTMNFYNVVGDRYQSELGRGIYLEIAQIEEQHVSHYESLADPTASWFEMLALHDYNEAYLYYSCMMSEPDQRIRHVWETNLLMELEHLRIDRELMMQYEKRDMAELFPKEFPQLTIFQSKKDYVREVLANQVCLTTNETEMVGIGEIADNHRYYEFQRMVNSGSYVPSVDVVEQHIGKMGQDYRLETEGQHPVQEYRSRGDGAQSKPLKEISQAQQGNQKQRRKAA